MYNVGAPEDHLGGGIFSFPYSEGQAVGAATQDKEPIVQHKSALIGECPDVYIQMNGRTIPFVLDTRYR